MYDFKTLETTDMKVLHKAFTDAFSDYQVKIDMPLWKLQQMLKRRGYTPEISMGAFVNGSLVGFILNGLRSWNGKLTAYDTGTGVIPGYRKQGITSNMFLNNTELLKDKNIKQYLLEVIQSNKPAVSLYNKQNFMITRAFKCFRLDKVKYKPMAFHTVEHIESIVPDEWERLYPFLDIKPSWQNSIDSINAVADTFTYSIVHINNEAAGYGIIDKKTGDIPQIAVSKKYRSKGVASSILTDMIENTESDRVSIINVDSGYKPLYDFCIKSGFESYIEQYEMVLEL